MGILKKEPNPVGRPSNESIKKKRNQKILVGVLATVAVLLVGGTVLLIATGTDLIQLMGNSTTKTVRVCPNRYSYNKTTGKCETTKSTIPACPTGGYTLINGKCEKLKSSTSGIQAVYNSTTKTYNCPSNKSDQWTTTKYVKSGQKTCIKNVYEVKSTVKGCEKGYTLTGGKCVKSVAPKTLKLSSSSYNFAPSFLGIENNIANYDIYVGSSAINYEQYDNSVKTELYEIKNGKYIKITDMDFESAKFVQFSFNSSKTYIARFAIKDAVTGTTVYAPYSKKITLTPSKISITPQITLLKSMFGEPYVGYENGKYRVDISLSNLDTIYSSLNFAMGDNAEGSSLIKLEIYEVVNGKNKYIAEYPMNVVYSTQIKNGEKKQYKVRLRFDEYGKKIYSDFSKVLTVDTNTFSS